MMAVANRSGHPASWAVQMPTWMSLQLEPPLVRVVQRLKEGSGIGKVHQHWHLELGCRRPKGTQARVIEPDQVPIRIAQCQTERFPDLEAPSPGADRGGKSLGLDDPEIDAP